MSWFIKVFCSRGGSSGGDGNNHLIQLQEAGSKAIPLAPRIVWRDLHLRSLTWPFRLSLPSTCSACSEATKRRTISECDTERVKREHRMSKQMELPQSPIQSPALQLHDSETSLIIYTHYD